MKENNLPILKCLALLNRKKNLPANLDQFKPVRREIKTKGSA
jgi:hypothetical protein